MARSDGNRYVRLIEHIFFDPMFGNYQPGKTEIPFGRDAIKKAAEALDIVLPLNIGDVIYAIRYRIKMPGKIAGSQPEGMEWTIEGAGHGQYKFVLTRANRIRPNTLLAPVKIPDATPEIIRRYALKDEQALLARVRYNRLIDIFLGVTTYSLQSHMRTSVRGIIRKNPEVGFGVVGT